MKFARMLKVQLALIIVLVKMIMLSYASMLKRR